MADKTEDGGPWTGCAVLFLQSLCPNVNLLSLYKDHQQGKFLVFKVIKLTLIGKHSVKPAVFPVQQTNSLLLCLLCGQILHVVWVDMKY